LHIVFSKMAMSAIIDFLNHRQWLCLAHSHHSHLHSLAKLPFVFSNRKAKQTQGCADCACKFVVKIMLKRHTKNEPSEDFEWKPEAEVQVEWRTTRRQRVCVWKRPVKQGDGHDRKPVAHAAWRCAKPPALLHSLLLFWPWQSHTTAVPPILLSSPNRMQFPISPRPHCTASSLKSPSLKLLQGFMVTTGQSV
jgi:hypothetical protein